MTDKVTCMLCGKAMSTINNKHLASHGITAAEYKDRYPEAPLVSETSRLKLVERSVRSNADRIGKKRSAADLEAIRAGIAARPSQKGIRRGPMTDSHRANLSAAHKAAFANGRVHGRLGKEVAPETKAKIAAALTGRTIPKEVVDRAVATRKASGLPGPMAGKTHSAETKAKIAANSSAHHQSTRSSRREPMRTLFDASKVELLNSIDDPIFQLRCLTCDHVFTRTPQMFHPSKWHPQTCDQCFPISPASEAENEVARFVAGLGLSVLRSDMDTIAPLELDVLVPEKKIAIEYCGLYWHSELAGKSRFYHRSKLDRSNDAGVRLITIFEDEWLTKRPIVEGMLRNALAANTTRLDARKCEVVSLPADEANTFLNANHIQGRGRSNVRYGLVHAGELVSVMTFNTSEVSRKRSGWEINRFCSLVGTNIRGAGSRLFARFVRDHSPQDVITYADLRYGSGGVYRSMGFEFVGNTVPNYWYFRPNIMERKHRFALRKQPGEDAGKTEWQIRTEQGWNRIWDCGHAKWHWKAS